jgi:hypothetical protein
VALEGHEGRVVDRTPPVGVYPVSVRLSEEVRTELDNASWVEDRPASDIIKEGIEMALAVIRAKHKGKIPERPRRQSAVTPPPPAEAQTPKKGRKK